MQFFNSLLSLFFLLLLIGMLNGIFWNFEFPLNLLAPISGATLGVFILNLFYKILEFTQTFVYFNTVQIILSYNLYALVFFITLIIGYLVIINDESRRKQEDNREEFTKRTIKERKKYHDSDRNLSWNDVEDEFKKVSLNIGKAVNKKFESKKEKDKKKQDKKK